MTQAIGNPVVVRKGIIRPSLTSSVMQNGVLVDMTGVTSVKFSMRPLVSRTPFINLVTASTITPADSNRQNVRYDWVSGDVAVEGEYMAWWTFTPTGGYAEETPEFPIIVSDHGPGTGTPTGVIVDGVASFMPVTFNALRNDNRFGDRFLQTKADVVKMRTLGTIIATDQEETYNPVLIDYLSKRLALELIDPAIDYWSRQHKSVSATGTSEMAVYPDMIQSLQALRVRFISELEQEWRDLSLIVPGLPTRKVMAMPLSSLGDPTNPLNGPLTTDPYAGRPLETGAYAWTWNGVWPFP